MISVVCVVEGAEALSHFAKDRAVFVRVAVPYLTVAVTTRFMIG